MALYALLIGLFSLYISKIRPKRRANNFVKKDVTYTQLRQITIDNECVEFKTSPKENEPMLLSVYPYNIIEAIIESKNYIQFVFSILLKTTYFYTFIKKSKKSAKIFSWHFISI